MKTKTEGSVRKLWVADLEAFRAHLLRLDPHSRHARFGMGASDDFVRRYAETSFSLDTIIHGQFDGDRIVGAGELRLLGRSRTEAEAAFSVERDRQARGVGSLLMERTLLTAQNRGIRCVYMNCLASNRQMQRLARRYGAHLEFEPGDVVGLVLPHQRTPVSVIKEAVSDSYGWATAIVDLQGRMIRTA
ncbi:GNAT family N-acetyltransferase [Prosthecomicrobium sp. N25]|uniref:GNAT family N-acetyltransferase n=1 Tax=Prosthecomicrobium sp. N25 TaxID=3129254 RepID=UPI003077FC67